MRKKILNFFGVMEEESTAAMRGPGPPGESLKAVEAPVNASLIRAGASVSSCCQAAYFFDKSPFSVLDSRLVAQAKSSSRRRWRGTRSVRTGGQPGCKSDRGVVSVTGSRWPYRNQDSKLAVSIAAAPMPPKVKQSKDRLLITGARDGRKKSSKKKRGREKKLNCSVAC